MNSIEQRLLWFVFYNKKVKMKEIVNFCTSLKVEFFFSKTAYTNEIFFDYS